jgi:hypothetical protein
MPAKIEGSAGVSEVGAKRFYLPGVVIVDTCPSCGVENRFDLSHQCLYYPSVNKPTPVSFCCVCEHEWEVSVILRVSLEIIHVG